MSRTLAAEYERLFDALGKSATQGPSAVLHRLQDLIGERGVDVERLRSRLNAQLIGETRRVIADLVENGDDALRARLGSLSLPAQEVFGERIHQIRELYLDDAVKRMQGEEDHLKRSFLARLTLWAEGETPDLDVADLVKQMRETSVQRARFFARDQFARFNRSVMVASYQEADAPYVEWLTSNDQRVRESHRERNHKVFTMAGLIADPEWKSYGCRCGFAPLWNLTADQKRRLVA
jgi:SPP1 gp7 family putative phage head morphogenesis protein